MAEITTDILISCTDENRRAGIKRIFVINKDEITSFTESTVATEFAYTAVTLSTSVGVWYEIEGEQKLRVMALRGQEKMDLFLMKLL